MKHPKGDDDLAARLDAAAVYPEPATEYRQWECVECGPGNFFDGLMSLDNLYERWEDLEDEFSSYVDLVAALRDEPNDPGIAPDYTENLAQRITDALSNEDRMLRTIMARAAKEPDHAPGKRSALEFKRARLRSLRPNIQKHLIANIGKGHEHPA